ncbi:TetR/AcrR family transcriptional regulator [Porphyromonas canoris]|uniref:TetR/AcrR family transcriptional regulator n=1 Tax=Porphyromonas canoris TaxID=36875 RepID=UPI00068E3C08|nr:TetR family transcriptional regulator [Porphyromonas canoris]
MALSKTRKIFVETARQLFAKIGVEATTMNDIAQAAKKGRRTLYTYFRSKEEIFAAVVQTELDTLYEELREFSEIDLPPQDKLVRFALRRFQAIDNIVKRNGSLDADFFRDIMLVERTRLKFDIKERRLIEKILQEGVDKKIYVVRDVKYMAYIIQSAFKGLEVPFIKGFISLDNEEMKNHLIDLRKLFINGLCGNYK